MLDRMGPGSGCLDVRPVEETSLTLPDGVVLTADIYRPEGDACHPVLLMRQPYGKSIASTVVLAHPAWYAAHGYVVVVQDVRGTGQSGGHFEPFVHEAADGAATLDWARGLPGGNGKIGTYGFSYQGMTQFMTLASGGCPDAMAVAMGPFCPEVDWVSEGGLCRVAAITAWAAQMARITANRCADAEALQRLDVSLPWQAHLAYLIGRPDLSHLGRWLEIGGAGREPANSLDGAVPEVPLFQVAGTSDFLLRGTLAADRAFRAVSPGKTHLVVTPWAHIPWNDPHAGPGAEFSVDRAQVAFFDFYLKGLGTPPASCLAHDSGTGVWSERDPATLHADPSRMFHLSSNGLAATMVSDGRLGEPGSGTGTDILVNDPTRPAPLVGGAAGDPSGPSERSRIDARADVACYTTPPLAEQLEIFGKLRLNLRTDLKGPLPGLAASLSRVLPDGRALVIATAVAEAADGMVQPVFDAVSTTILPGERLRLSIQAAPFPEYLHRPLRSLPDPGFTTTTVTIRHLDSVLLLPAGPQE